MAEQAADPKLIAEVKRLKAANPDWSNLRVATEMGTHAGVTAAIFNNLGLPLNPRGMRPKDLRELVLKAHNEEKLTITQMIEKYPQIGTYFATTGKVKVRDGVVRLLSVAGLTPYTEEAVIVQQTQERRTPLVAAEIRRIIIGWLRNPKLEEQNPAFGQNLLLRIPDNERIAQLTGESESLVSDAMGLLLAEERPIIQLLEGIIQGPAHVQLRAKRGESS